MKTDWEFIRVNFDVCFFFRSKEKDLMAVAELIVFVFLCFVALCKAKFCTPQTSEFNRLAEIKKLSLKGAPVKNIGHWHNNEEVRSVNQQMIDFLLKPD